MDERSHSEELSELASRYLGMLSEETMHRAWGKNTSVRRDIALAAVIFSRRFEERASEAPRDSGRLQPFLMSLMNDVISDFAEAREMSRESASELLGDVAVRDRVLEFNEVIEEYEAGSEESLDGLLAAAVTSRRRRAGWADHWSSG